MKDDIWRKQILKSRLSVVIQAELAEAALSGINVVVEDVSDYESLMPSLTKTEKDYDVHVAVTAHVYVSGFENVPATDAVIRKLADNAVNAIQSLMSNQDAEEKGGD